MVCSEPIRTLRGPWVPLNSAEAICILSYPLSVLKLVAVAYNSWFATKTQSSLLL